MDRDSLTSERWGASAAQGPTDSPGRSLRAGALLALGGILILGVAAWSQRLGPYLGGGDDAIYLILGRDLAEQGTYRDRYFPGAPAHRQYPPGYPLMIATVLRGLGDPNILDAVAPLRAMSLAFLLCSVPLFLALERGRERTAVLLAAVFLWLFHPTAIELAGSVLTEVPYLFFSLLGMLAFERLVLGERDASPPKPFRVGLAAAALAWPVYLRMNGIALGMAAVGVLSQRRRWRAALLVGGLWLAMLLPLPAVMAGGGSKAGYGGLLFAKDIEGYDASPATIVDLGHRLVASVGAYAAMLPDALFLWGKFGRAALPVALPLVAALLLVGLVGRLRAGHAYQELYVFLSVLILVAFPIRSFRYLVPLLPFLTLYVARGADTVAQSLGRSVKMPRPAWLARGALTALVLVGFASGLHFHRAEVAEAARPPAQRTYEGWVPGQWEAIDWIAAHAPQQAVAMLRKPQLLYLLTGRKGVTYPYTSAGDVMQQIERYHVQYVVEEPSIGAERYVKPVLERLASQGRTTLAYETSGRVPNRIWRVDGRGAVIARVPLSGPPGRGQ